MADPAYRSPWGRGVGGAMSPPPVEPTGGPGKKSFVAPWFGGASRPTGIPEFRYGFRSVLTFFIGGGCKPPSTGTYAGPRSIAAYWLGGAAFHYIPEPERELIVGGEGIPFAKHHGKPIDDEEIIEFLRLWVSWQDIE